MANSVEELDQVIKQAEAIHLVSLLEVRRQLKESGASEAELDEQQPIDYSEQQIVELKRIAEEMLSTQGKGKGKKKLITEAFDILTGYRLFHYPVID